jgi:hypothetical protein
MGYSLKMEQFENGVIQQLNSFQARQFNNAVINV